MNSIVSITEPWENEMRVVVLARKNVAAMKTGARHLLRSVGVLSPSTGTQFFPSAFANGHTCTISCIKTKIKTTENNQLHECQFPKKTRPLALISFPLCFSKLVQQ